MPLAIPSLSGITTEMTEIGEQDIKTIFVLDM
jgi:hypothetical protein